MNTIIYSKKERAFFWACAYLGALFISTIILWWTVLIGGNPLTFKSSEVTDRRGQAISVVHRGQSVGIRRYVCSTRSIGVEFYPTLRDQDGLFYPLQSGMFSLSKGCEVKTYGFIVPPLPPGEYTYQSVIRFQTSLVGRDDMVSSPEIKIRIEQ